LHLSELIEAGDYFLQIAQIWFGYYRHQKYFLPSNTSSSRLPATSSSRTCSSIPLLPRLSLAFLAVELYHRLAAKHQHFDDIADSLRGKGGSVPYVQMQQNRLFEYG
jgi:hypothetical protein